MSERYLWLLKQAIGRNDPDGAIEVAREALAVARKEGRREEEAKHDADCRCGPNSGSHLDWAYHSPCTLRRIAKDQADQIASLLCEVERLKVAHAAQLVALREACHEAAWGEALSHVPGCNCLVCQVAGAMLTAINTLPLPDAEAAPEKVRAAALGWAWDELHVRPAPEDREFFVKEGLAALGAKP